MAVATYTSSTFTNNPPKQRVYGTTWQRGKMVYSGTLSDILFLCKVPHGAKIVDFMEYHSNGETAAVFNFGFDRGIADGGAGNASCLITAAAVATMNRMSFATAANAVPTEISLSDTDPVRYAILQAKAVSGTFTISVSLTWAISYTMD